MDKRVRGTARWGRKLGLALVLAAVLAGAAHPAAAQVRGEDLTVSVITFGPGLHPFFKFGHNAVLIEHASGQGWVYNFGMFDFSSPALIPKFILGRSMYWLARTPRDPTIRGYVSEDRSVEIQELDLTPTQRKAMLNRLEDNARPENRYYLYDYFYDNCSTRVRDVVDVITSGLLRRQGQTPATLTFREHALRLTADLTWEYLALLYALGVPADKQATRWEEGFIPMELRDHLRTVTLPDGRGGQKPLVKAERLIHRSSRPPPPNRPPDPTWVFALLGFGLGAAFALGGWAGRTRPVARMALGIGSGLFGFVVGLLGLLLLFLWVATNHRAAHANANILQTVPWGLVFVVWGVKAGRGRRLAIRRAFRAAQAAAAASLLGLLLGLVGIWPQANLAVVALCLPAWAGLLAGTWFLRRSTAGEASGLAAGEKR